MVWKQIFFHPSLLLLFLDPVSGMGKNQDPGSRIRNTGYIERLLVSFFVIAVSACACSWNIVKSLDFDK